MNYLPHCNATYISPFNLLKTCESSVNGNAYTKLSDWYDAQDILLDAQLQAANSKRERVAIWEKLLQTRQEMEKKAEALAKLGVKEGSQADFLRARGTPKGRTRFGQGESAE